MDFIMLKLEKILKMHATQLGEILWKCHFWMQIVSLGEYLCYNSTPWRNLENINKSKSLLWIFLHILIEVSYSNKHHSNDVSNEKFV